MPLSSWHERSFLTSWKIHPLKFAIKCIVLIEALSNSKVRINNNLLYAPVLLDTHPLLMDALTIWTFYPSVLLIILSFILGRSPIQFIFIISCLAYAYIGFWNSFISQFLPWGGLWSLWRDTRIGTEYQSWEYGACLKRTCAPPPQRG